MDQIQERVKAWISFVIAHTFFFGELYTWQNLRHFVLFFFFLSLRLNITMEIQSDRRATVINGKSPILMHTHLIYSIKLMNWTRNAFYMNNSHLFIKFVEISQLYGYLSLLQRTLKLNKNLFQHR